MPTRQLYRRNARGKLMPRFGVTVTPQELESERLRNQNRIEREKLRYDFLKTRLGYEQGKEYQARGFAQQERMARLDSRLGEQRYGRERRDELADLADQRQFELVKMAADRQQDIRKAEATQRTKQEEALRKFNEKMMDVMIEATSVPEGYVFDADTQAQMDKIGKNMMESIQSDKHGVAQKYQHMAELRHKAALLQRRAQPKQEDIIYDQYGNSFIRQPGGKYSKGYENSTNKQGGVAERVAKAKANRVKYVADQREKVKVQNKGFWELSEKQQNKAMGRFESEAAEAYPMPAGAEDGGGAMPTPTPPQQGAPAQARKPNTDNSVEMQLVEKARQGDAQAQAALDNATPPVVWRQ